MQFCFYPNHEYSCEHVKHCPHLGSAALGTLVHVANSAGSSLDHLHRSLDAERKRNAQLVEENQRLRDELAQANLELKLERQNQFATNQQPQEDCQDASADHSHVTEESALSKQKKKRGAPVGHPGWFRPTPTQYDWHIDVPPPRRCPHCHGRVTTFDTLDPSEHLQEDILDGVYRVILYRHHAGCCDDCGRWVEQAGQGEILGCRIGPHLRSKAVYLRNLIGISYRKVPQAIEELFGITFTPAALLGFESMLAGLAEPVVEDIARKLSSSDGPVHADETYWTLDGKRAYYWVRNGVRNEWHCRL